MSLSLSTRAATLIAAAALAFSPSALRAQKALVYCPVATDAAGCTTIASALAAEPSAFPGGIDLGYGGADGTVDLATADLSAYAVVVVPSLADGEGVTPYALLRDPAVAARLRAALTGRAAVWSGTPDRGTSNRAAKDALLRNLARWAMADSAAGRGSGLVVLQDNSDDPAARYAWLGGIASVTVEADTTLEVYANVQVLTATGGEILTANGLQIGYSNMASYGLVPAAGGTADATGGRTSRAVLVTTETAGESSIAMVRTDREDYAPGDTVLISGTGWAPGETVRMSLHEDPLVHGDRTFTAVADATGQISNNQFSPEEHDFGVRFVLTALGETSGRTAQTTFTDGNKLEFTTAAFTVATGTCSPAITVRLLQGNTPENGHPTPVALSSNSGGGTFYSNSSCTSAVTSVTIPTSSPSVSFFYKDATPGTPTLTAVANSAGGCNSANCTVTQTETITTTTTTTVTTSGTPSVFGQSVTFTASVTAAVGTVPAGGTVTFKDGAATLGTGTTNGSGQATFTAAALSVSSHAITAVYAGTPAFPTSTSAVLTQTVNQANTTTTITADTPDPSLVGQAVNVSYTVAVVSPGAGTRTGNVTVSDGVNSCTGTVAAGSCALTLTTSGARTLTATYAGDGQFNESTSAGVPHQVNVANAAPTATADAYNVDEDNTLTVAAPGVLGNDIDPNGDAITAVLVANVSHGTLTLNANGSFTYTPAANYNGPDTFTYQATDGSLSSAVTTVTITVNPVNDAPVLNAIGNKTVDEGTPLAFTATATDPEGSPLTFSLGAGAPAGAAITAAGAFTWTPTEAQGPGTYSVTVRVSDGLGGEDTETITIAVNEANQAPVLADVPASATIPEQTPYTFTATATDADQPAQTLTFSLVGAPAGATINASTGAFSWTPSEAQGPGTYPFSVRVSDGITDTDAPITLTVTEVNVPPVLTGVPASATIDEETAYTFDADAIDVDDPPQPLTFSLVGAPAGAGIDASTGAFSWTPSEAQGPGTYTFSVHVSDGVDYADASVAITVKEVNRAPTLTAIANKTVDEGTALTFTASATDPDLPANTLTYALGAGAPAGATIDAGTGAFSWTPTEAQGPGSYPVTVTVSDGSASDSKSFTVTVNEVNAPPVVQPIASQSVDEGETVTFAAVATDPDIPVNTLTYSLVGAPAGAAINPTTGAFSWATGEADGPGVYTFQVVATDNGTPMLSGETTVQLTVKEVNVAPVLAAIGNKTVDELTALTFAAGATDADLPANALTYSLVGAPAGATINASTGAFSWTPTEAQGPGSYTFTVRVTDDGTPTLSDEETITVTVKEVNEKPTLAAITSRTVNEGTPVAFTAAATDPDVPANTLTYSLVGAPAGATINPMSGVFTWTPTDDNPTGTPSDAYTFTVRVTDNGTPALSDERTVTITVNNVAPAIAAITAPVVPVNITAPVTVSATFNDVGSGDTHTALIAWGDGQTTSATVSETNGSGTATGSHTYPEAGVYTVTVTVTDDDGGSVTQTHSAYVVVYDPSAGFVTGGGWIMSPAGAYLPAPSLTGKATFGFVSKYQKGANVPTGNTEFQFHAGDFNFSSTSYEWLVVSGSSKASYKGEGTVNGRGRYGFMLSVIDGDTDKFRIKIWDKNAGDVVVYDNQMGAAVDADATTAIASGNIVVHATKSTASK